MSNKKYVGITNKLPFEPLSPKYKKLAISKMIEQNTNKNGNIILFVESFFSFLDSSILSPLKNVKIYL